VGNAQAIGYKIVIGAGNVQAQRNRYIWTMRGSDDGIVYEMLIEAVEKKRVDAGNTHCSSSPIASPNFLYATY
jgi:hypothetical protein